MMIAAPRVSRALLLLLHAVALAACRPAGISPSPGSPVSDPQSPVAPHVEPSRPPETPIATISPIAPHVEPSRPPETPIGTLVDEDS